MCYRKRLKCGTLELELIAICCQNVYQLSNSASENWLIELEIFLEIYFREYDNIVFALLEPKTVILNEISTQTLR